VNREQGIQNAMGAAAQSLRDLRTGGISKTNVQRGEDDEGRWRPDERFFPAPGQDAIMDPANAPSPSRRAWGLVRRSMPGIDA
jgi:hypothetical protein